ncbi:ketoacyl-ACP synthase III family protein [Saccharothrix sp. HUAS TT1]|uniref:ketoacyl-ACP synthase III family protein n=1 Tax=unclassified Saccharothrix TaxID=2593673 RepID=UPI00345C490D
MKWSDVHLRGSAMWLGRAEDVRDAVAAGRYDADEAISDDLAGVRIADEGDVPVEMAVTAARGALERSGVSPEQVELILHAHVGHQGVDQFAPASYVQGQAVPGRANAVEIRQASNGGMAALHLAAAYLSAASGPAAALVTTADKFPEPAWDRYRADNGLILADGATSLVLSREPGLARLLSSVIIGDATHEQLYRGEGPWTGYPGESGWPVDLRERKEQYFAKGADLLTVIGSITRHQEESLLTALDEAEVKVDEVARFVFPHVGRILQDWESRKALGIDESRTTWPWGRTVGHLGAGDQIAGLNHLLETGEVGAGDKVVLCGVGNGWAYSAAVVEITQDPTWANAPAGS